jgi:hypothetical protein
MTALVQYTGTGSKSEAEFTGVAKTWVSGQNDVVSDLNAHKLTKTGLWSYAPAYLEAQARAVKSFEETGTTYTAALRDAGAYIKLANAGAIVFTIPPESSVPFPINTVLTVEQAGAGAITVTAGVGVALNTAAVSAITIGQYAVARIVKTATNTWAVSGDVTGLADTAVQPATPLGIVEITGDTTISAIHANKVLQVNSGSNVTLTLHPTAPAGFSFLVDQVGVGLAIFALGGSATKINRQSFDRTAGQGAIMTAYVRSNAGSAAVWVLGGDGDTA